VHLGEAVVVEEAAAEETGITDHLQAAMEQELEAITTTMAVAMEVQATEVMIIRAMADTTRATVMIRLAMIRLHPRGEGAHVDEELVVWQGNREEAHPVVSRDTFRIEWKTRHVAASLDFSTNQESHFLQTIICNLHLRRKLGLEKGLPRES